MSIEEIYTIVWSCLLIFGFVVFIIFMSTYNLKQEEMRKQYLDTLDEHDKSVILTYTHIKPSADDFKKKGK